MGMAAFGMLVMPLISRFFYFKYGIVGISYFSNSDIAFFGYQENDIVKR